MNTERVEEYMGTFITASISLLAIDVFRILYPECNFGKH